MDSREERTHKLFDIITTVVVIVFLIYVFVKFLYF
jgi:hypothetical protein